MSLEQGNQKLTLATYMALPVGHYNLIDGVLHVTPSPSPRHQTLVVRLAVALSGYVVPRKLGAVWMAPLDVFLRELDPAVVVQPDVLYVARDGRARIDRRGVVGPPELAVEVLSPSSTRMDGVQKRSVYEQYGVREYWMVHADLDQVEVLRRGPDGAFTRPALLDTGDVLTTPLLADFDLQLADLFAPDELAPADLADA